MFSIYTADLHIKVASNIEIEAAAEIMGVSADDIAYWMEEEGTCGTDQYIIIYSDEESNFEAAYC